MTTSFKIFLVSMTCLIATAIFSYAVEVPVFHGVLISPSSETSFSNEKINKEMFQVVDNIEVHKGAPVAVVAAFPKQEEILSSSINVGKPSVAQTASAPLAETYKKIADLDYVRSSQIIDKNDLPGYKNPLRRRNN